MNEAEKKAFVITNSKCEELGAVVVYAKTAGQAKNKAICVMDMFDNEYTEMRARRAAEFDKYYPKCRDYLDWEMDEDRLLLVKHGWQCSMEIECEGIDCPAHHICDRYKEYEIEG